MAKKDLVIAVQSAIEVTAVNAGAVVDAVVGSIQQQLAEGGECFIDGVGTFKVQTRPARTGRNPRTGDALEIGERSILKFKASKTLKDILNTKKTKKGAAKKA